MASTEFSISLLYRSFLEAVMPNYFRPKRFNSRPKDKSLVLVTGFSSPNRVTVLDVNYLDSFLKVIDDVNAYGYIATPFSRALCKNTYALASIDNSIYRVQITNAISIYDIRVILIDYGGRRVCHLKQLFDIPIDCLRKPVYTATIQLHNVPNFALSPLWLDFLKTQQYRFYIIVYNPTHNQGPAYLFRRSGKVLNKCIMQFGEGKPIYKSKNSNDYDFDANGDVDSDVVDADSSVDSDANGGNAVSTEETVEEEEMSPESEESDESDFQAVKDAVDNIMNIFK